MLYRLNVQRKSISPHARVSKTAQTVIDVPRTTVALGVKARVVCDDEQVGACESYIGAFKRRS